MFVKPSNLKFDLKIQVKVMVYNIRNSAIRWQIHDFIVDGTSNVCSISHHLRNEMILKMKFKVKEEKLGTCTI